MYVRSTIEYGRVILGKILLGLFCFGSGCSLNQVVLPELPEFTAETQPVIVVLGSSTAAGAGASAPDYSWVNRFEAFLQKSPSYNGKVINLAAGGYTTYHILPAGTAETKSRPTPDLARNITAALAHKPTMIIINLPSNDIALNYPVDKVLNNYRLVVDAAAPVPVYITTTQPRNLSQAQRTTLKRLKEITKEVYGIKAIDFWTDIARADGTIKSEFNMDGIHVNDRGHEILFQRVANSVKFR